MARFGEKLRNGATIIDAKPQGNGPHQIVLAFTGGPQPYVTWEEYHHPGAKPATGTGHYFDNIVDAAQSFERR